MPYKRAKYGSRKTEVDGITFHSKREANRYCELKLLKQAGEIVDFELQPPFLLQSAFVHRGVKYRSISYRGDFRILYPDGRQVVEDVKGYADIAVYRLKKKLLLCKYPDIEFIET
jgi:hypothetical protein